MVFTRQIQDIINYAPEALKSFSLIMYEWIDNLHFTVDLTKHITNADEYIAVAKELFLEAGWWGDGEIVLMWIPPFMLRPEGYSQHFFVGVIVWHVKQQEDGISWILSPIKLPYES